MRAIPDVLAPLIDAARLKHVPRGQILLYAGDKPLDIFILQDGVVKIYDIDDQGNEKILHIVQPPAVLPLAAFSGGKMTTQWFYNTVVDCQVRVIPKAAFEDILATNQQLAAYLMRWFSREVHELLVRLSSLGKTNTRDKLVAVLKFFVVHHSAARRGGWQHVNFPVSHQLLADMIGVTRESAAMSMKDLQDERVVRYPRLTMLELNAEKLMVL